MFCIRALFSYPKIFATFPVLARSDFRLSWHTLPTVISTRRYSIVKERIICGGSYQICRIHYGGSIHFTKYNNIPSTGSQREGTKSAMKFKSFQKVYNCLHFTRDLERMFMRIKCNPSYTYKGSCKIILVGCYCKYPSLNSHGKRLLVGYFFKNSKYVYNIPSYKSLGKGRKLRNKRKHPHLLPPSSRF